MATAADRGTVEEAVAYRLLAEPTPRRSRAATVLHDLSLVDRSIYEAIAGQETPSLDVSLRRLSNLANRSVLWLGIAGAVALVGGRRGRRAARDGVIAIGVTSALVNLGLKALYPRQRPDREGSAVPDERQVRMPASTSFPSGHSASGFAFATALGLELPELSLPLELLAAAVAYSRVHSGVHYPGDVVAGALVGGVSGQAVARALRHRPRIGPRGRRWGLLVAE